MRKSFFYLNDFFGSKPLVGVEVGVAKGENAVNILNGMVIEKLYLVDPYMEYHEESQETLDLWKNIADSNLKNYNNIERLFCSSHSASKNIKLNKLFDFVYIDAGHSYEECYSDIKYWVDRALFVCGHDYGCDGVTLAVNAICKENNLSLMHFDDTDWILLK